jgi:hypothetical protein
VSIPPTPPRDPEHVARLLSAGLAATPEDLDHPAYDQLTALVDGRLDAVDREWVEGHIGHCDVCREDVADLVEIRASLGAGDAAAPAPARTWLKPAIGFGAVAAGVMLAIWIGGRTPSPAMPDAPVVASNPAPSVPAPAVNVLTSDEQAAVAGALASGQVELPSHVSLLRGRVGTLLGSSPVAAPFTSLTPVRTSVLTARPQFSWTAIAGATSYVVAVFDENFNEVAQSRALTVLTWQPAADLPRGRLLAWQVTAGTPGGAAVSPAPPQPEARFIVLSAADAAAMDAQRVRLGGEPVALGLALAKAGLFEEARVALTRALTDARYDAVQVRALLDQIAR